MWKRMLQWLAGLLALEDLCSSKPSPYYSPCRTSPISELWVLSITLQEDRGTPPTFTLPPGHHSLSGFWSCSVFERSCSGGHVSPSRLRPSSPVLLLLMRWDLALSVQGYSLTPLPLALILHLRDRNAAVERWPVGAEMAWLVVMTYL